MVIVVSVSVTLMLSMLLLSEMLVGGVDAGGGWSMSMADAGADADAEVASFVSMLLRDGDSVDDSRVISTSTAAIEVELWCTRDNPAIEDASVRVVEVGVLPETWMSRVF